MGKYKNKYDESGIYKIHCIANNKFYIGYTAHIWSRLCREHFGFLKRDKHPNKHLQAAFNRYGAGTFEWSVYKLCPPGDLEKEEILAISVIGRENLFNFTDGGDGMKGYRHSTEVIVEDSKRKKEEWASGKYNNLKMAIRRINVFTGTITNYARSGLAEADGFDGRNIGACIRGEKKTHKGFFWQRADDNTAYEELKSNLNLLNLQSAKCYYSFAMKLDGETEIEDGVAPRQRKKHPFSKPIERIDLETGLVKEYISVAQAADDGFDRSTIQKALKGEYASYRGFYWNYLK